MLGPDPYDPESKPTKRLITLVTYSELFTDDRKVVFGHLVSSQQRPAA